MREIRQSGSEGGGSRTQSVLPTPILLCSASGLDALDTLIALPTDRHTTNVITSQAAPARSANKPDTTRNPAPVAVFTSPKALEMTVLSQNPTTPLSAHRRHRGALRCGEPQSP
jgi:hypothetical protein